MPIAIVGPGVTGSEIAGTGAAAGRDVLLIDAAPEALAAACEHCDAITARRRAKGRLDTGEAASVRAHITTAGPAPMGPFALGNLVGLDALSFLLRDLEAAYGECFAQGSALPELVAAGSPGQKTGVGFAPADQAPRHEGDSAAAEAYDAAAGDEAELWRDERVAAADDIDLAMCLGAGRERGPREGRAS